MQRKGMTAGQYRLKRAFDVIISFLGILAIGVFLPLLILLARTSCGNSGLFRQQRVGRFGKAFTLLKLRTMKNMKFVSTTVTTDGDPRITRIGRFLRKTKLDELPQLVNVLKGDMSFVGPRPDVAGYADKLQGADRIILEVRPGITGPATLKFRNEEQLLAFQEDPETFNREVIWPEKVRLNVEYVENYSFRRDIWYIWKTLLRD